MFDDWSWDPWQDIKDMGTAVGKNVERNVSSTFENLGYAISTGDYSNLDQTLINMGLMYATGGASALANPDDIKGLTGNKETTVERAKREAGNKARQMEADAKVAAEQERIAKISAAIDAQIERSLARPGRSQTLFGVSSPGTLLTKV